MRDITAKRRAWVLKVLREHRGSYLTASEIALILLKPVESKAYNFDVLEVLHGLHADGLVSRTDRVLRSSKRSYGWAVPA